jgi:ATPase subunit of ABC transporter with duplicated ATPase domains
MHSVVLETTAGLQPLALPSGTVTLIVGPNGVGKSALLQDIYRKLPTGQANYYPGHRQITFSHGWENLQMSLTDLDNNLFAQIEGFNRYKSVWPEEQFKSVLRRIQNAEAAYNEELIEQLRTGGDAAYLLSQKGSPVQLLNTIFQTARMAVSFKLTDIGLTAVRDNSEYQVDRLSDGERAALFLAAAIVNRRSEGVLLIDEPERHLHPSISAPLISAAVRARPESRVCIRLARPKSD